MAQLRRLTLLGFLLFGAREALHAPIPLAQAGVLGEAMARNAPLFIPDVQRSTRLAQDPTAPATRSAAEGRAEVTPETAELTSPPTPARLQ